MAERRPGFTDGNTTGNDYNYDANGSMSLDKNKSITSITYNYLHLPERVIKNTGEYIQYVYDASGKKLRQKVFSPTTHKKTDYNGELYAENDTLKFISQEEGRVVTKGGTAEYQYFLKDHLGNVRVTFTSVQTPVTTTAGFESANATTEAATFQNYPTGANLVMNATFAHAGVYSERLTGGANGQVGVTKSFSVVPGDVVSISAYGKYSAPTSTAGN